MNALRRTLTDLRGVIESIAQPPHRLPARPGLKIWAVDREPKLRNRYEFGFNYSVAMSDGKHRWFDSWREACGFIADNPPPPVREQLEASLAATERRERDEYHAEEAFWDRQVGREEID